MSSTPTEVCLAVGETISHLNYLMHAGAVTRHRKDGINWYAPA